MKVQLIDVVTDYEEIIVDGTCELCFSTEFFDKQTYVYDVDGKKYEIMTCNEIFGYYEKVVVDNVIDYADWLNKQTFDDVDEDNIEDFLFELVNQYNQNQ